MGRASRTRLQWVILAFGVLVVLILTSHGLALLGKRRHTMTVMYRGVAFQVDKENPAYNPEQVAAIEHLALAVEPPLEFPSYASLCEFHSTVEVTGSGSSGGGFGDVTEAGQFTSISWQIPTKPKHRVLVYRRSGENAPYRLFDDFVHESAYPPLLTFTVEAGQMAYRSQTDGQLIRTRPLVSD